MGSEPELGRHLLESPFSPRETEKLHFRDLDHGVLDPQDLLKRRFSRDLLATPSKHLENELSQLADKMRRDSLDRKTRKISIPLIEARDVTGLPGSRSSRRSSCVNQQEESPVRASGLRRGSSKTLGTSWDPVNMVYVPSPTNQDFGLTFESVQTQLCSVPDVFLELPSDSDSSRRPSHASQSTWSAWSQQSSRNPSRMNSRRNTQGSLYELEVSRYERRSSSAESSGNMSTSLLDVPGVSRSRGQSLPSGSSLPSGLESQELYRSRNFSISGGRIINKGDSFNSNFSSRASSCNCLDQLSRSSSKSRSPSLVSSTDSVRSAFNKQTICSRGSSTSSKQSSRNTSRNSSVENSPLSDMLHKPEYKVCVLGSSQVGKSSLTSQFLTSEHVDTYDSVGLNDLVEKRVMVNVDGEESSVIFVDYQYGDLPVPEMMKNERPDGALVVFAVDDVDSLREGRLVLNHLKQTNFLSSQATILVANKVDLVRSRLISSSEGKHIAKEFNVKYIETSPGLNLNIDELLVGILTQIKLREESDAGSNKQTTHQNKVCSFLGRVLKRKPGFIRSCTNLTVL